MAHAPAPLGAVTLNGLNPDRDRAACYRMSRRLHEPGEPTNSLLLGGCLHG